MEWVIGQPPKVCPIITQDITPYCNDLYHINSIMQLTIVTDKPVEGVAITTEVPFPGCDAGASHPTACAPVIEAFTTRMNGIKPKKGYDALSMLQTQGDIF